MPASAASSPTASPAARASARASLDRAVRADDGAAGPRGATAARLDLARRLDALSPQDRARAEALLARPDDSDGDDSLDYGNLTSVSACSARFCVHYVRSGRHAPDLADTADATGAPGRNGVPDYVDLMLREFENVATVEQDTLGWPAPIGDGTKGGGQDKFDVYIGDIGENNLYGYASTDGQTGTNPDRFKAYMAMDDDYSAKQFEGNSSPADALRVTAAHEYNHVLQYAIDGGIDDWYAESVATWMEDTVYPDSTDWLNYLEGWSGTPESPLTTFSSAGATENRQYGSSVFVHWLADNAGLGSRGVLDSYLASPAADQYAVGAVDASLAARGLPSVSGLFGRFAAGTAEWRVPGSGFHDRGLYGTIGDAGADVARTGTLATGQSRTGTIDHLAYRLFDVPKGTARGAQLTVTAPDGLPSSIALVGRTGGIDDGTVAIQRVELPAGGRGTVVLDDVAQYERITAVVANTSTGIDPNAAQRTYTGDRGRYELSLAAYDGPPVPPSPVVVPVAPVAPITPVPVRPVVTPPLGFTAVVGPLRATRTTLQRALTPHGITTLRRGIRRLQYAAPGRGRLDVSVLIGTLKVAGGRATARAAGPLVVRVTARSSTKRILTRRPARRVRLVLTFTPENGRARTIGRTMTIRR
jgi:hypothetical protein